MLDLRLVGRGSSSRSPPDARRRRHCFAGLFYRDADAASWVPSSCGRECAQGDLREPWWRRRFAGSAKTAKPTVLRANNPTNTARVAVNTAPIISAPPLGPRRGRSAPSRSFTAGAGAAGMGEGGITQLPGVACSPILPARSLQRLAPKASNSLIASPALNVSGRPHTHPLRWKNTSRPAQVAKMLPTPMIQNVHSAVIR
jgi:hypothetical protein